MSDRKLALYVAEGNRWRFGDGIHDYVDGPVWIYSDRWYVIERNGTYAYSLLGSTTLNSRDHGRSWPQNFEQYRAATTLMSKEEE